jgi:FkbM family methyltransferase
VVGLGDVLNYKMRYLYGDWYDILNTTFSDNKYRDYLRPNETTDELFYFSDGMNKSLEEVNTLGVCHEVLGIDCYNFRELANDGFKPKFVLDIGGHIGTASLLMNKIWPDCRILSVESNPYTYAVNKLNSVKFGGWEIMNWTMIGFHEYDKYGNFDNITIRDSCEFETMVRGGYHDETVAPGISVKEFLTRYDVPPKIDLVKIDVEGSEAMIISEMKLLGLLSNIDYIIGEWHYSWVRKHIQRELSDTHIFTSETEGEFNHFNAVHKRIYKLKKGLSNIGNQETIKL